MPRTKLDKFSAVKRDALKGLILEYMAAQNISKAEVASRIGIGRATFSRRMSEHTDEWPVKEVIAVCKLLKIPKDELVKTIRI